MNKIWELPNFEDSEITRRAQIFFKLIWSSVAIISLGLIIILFLLPEYYLRWITVISIAVFGNFILLYMNNKGYTRFASTLLIIFYIAIILGLSWNAGGIFAPIIQILPSIVLISGILLGWKEGIFTGITCIIGGFLLLAADYLEILPVSNITHTPFSLWIISVIIISLMVYLQFITIGSLDKALYLLREELSLRQNSELRLQSINSNLTSGMIYQIVKGKDGSRKFTYLSDSVKELYGISPEEGIANPNLIYDKIYKDDYKALIDAEEKAMKTLSPFKSELRLTDPSGNIRWSSFVSTPTKMKDGSICWDGIEFVITERKIAEEKMRSSEEKFSKLFHSSPDAILVTEIKTGKIAEINKTFEKLCGYSRQELIGNYVLEFGMYTKEQREIFVNLLTKDGYVHDHEFNLANKAGNRFIMLASAEIIDISGVPHAITILKDITMRKKDEEELQKSENRMRAIIEGTPHLFFYVQDSNANTTYVSITVEQITGYKPEVWIKQRDWFITDADINQNAKQQTYKHLKGESSGEPFIIEVRHANGNPILLEIYEYPAFQNGSIIGLQGVAHDITERRRIENELIKSKELAEQSDKMKSSFLAQISHEIRTPISVILSNLGLIESDLDDKLVTESKECFHAINLASTRIIRTIDLILNMSELQVGAYKPMFSKVNIDSQILRHIISEFQISARAKKIDLSYKKDIADPIITADNYSITQIFANLIDNAIKYTKVGYIEVALYRNEDSRIVVEIKDTGIGISKEFLPHLFESFIQEEQGYTRSYEGNGLGLALVKKYCEINNALIDAESEKNVGTKFRVTFLGN